MAGLLNLLFMDFINETLSGWGNIPKSEGSVYYPQSANEIKTGIGQIARGLGRSYADQSTNKGGVVAKMEKMNRILAFDPQTGVLQCESGVSFEDIIQLAVPTGWFPAITPGTKFLTVGGAIANDVHGKAHHADGSFINCVTSFTIMLASGEIVNASRDENPDLFMANFGGLGLLGIILTAIIRLRKIETTYFKQRAIVTRNLDEMLDAIEATGKEYSYSVAWIDPLARGEMMGKGVLTVGNHARLGELPESLKKAPLRIARRSWITVPFYLPGFALNNFTVRILNAILYWRLKSAPEFSHYEGFFYPLDSINGWNRGYGRRGFIQYQFVLPLADGRKNIRSILDEIAESNCIPFLNVLKKFGVGQSEYLSFPMEGYTFAIDFPITSRLREFTARLDQMVLGMGGRIYLGKDAWLSESSFKAMYPQHADWLAVKRKYDPQTRFSSDLSRRIGLT